MKERNDKLSQRETQKQKFLDTNLRKSHCMGQENARSINDIIKECRVHAETDSKSDTQ